MMVTAVAMPAGLGWSVVHVERVGVAIPQQTGCACQTLLIGVEATVAVRVGNVVPLYAESPFAGLSRST